MVCEFFIIPIAATMPTTLPAELWIRILSLIGDNDNDRPKLWVSGRAVCSTFKEAIEAVFREKHLPKTYISYHLGTHYPDFDSDSDSEEISTPSKVLLDLRFELSHLSEDKSTAFFKVDPPVNAKYKPLVCNAIKSYLHANQFEMPLHTVQVRHELNDTPIPGLHIDYDTMVLSCEWRGLFSTFFAEELLVHNLREKALEKFQAQRDALIENVHSGRVDMIDAMQQVLIACGDENDKARMKARRMRIRWQYEEESPGFEWRPEEWDLMEEERINRELKEMIFFASMVGFSDEGGETADEEDDEDGDGDWEDEEGEEDNGREEGENDDGEGEAITDNHTTEEAQI